MTFSTCMGYAVEATDPRGNGVMHFTGHDERERTPCYDYGRDRDSING